MKIWDSKEEDGFCYCTKEAAAAQYFSESFPLREITMILLSTCLPLGRGSSGSEGLKVRPMTQSTLIR